MFGKLGVTCRNFRDPNAPNATGVMAEMPDMPRCQELLQSDEGKRATREDGLTVEPMRMLVEFTPSLASRKEGKEAQRGTARRGVPCIHGGAPGHSHPPGSRPCLLSNRDDRHRVLLRAGRAGTFRLHSGQHFLSQALNDEDIGLEAVQDGLWNLIYDETLLGRFDEHTHLITGAPALKKKC